MAKKCIKCGLSQKKSSFYKCSSTKDGLNPYCKDCNRTAGKECIARNKEKNIKRGKIFVKEKKCFKCKKLKNSNHFSVDKYKHDGLSSFCKDCVRVVCKEFNKKNPEYSAQYNTQYYKENKEEIKAHIKKYNIENKAKIRAHGRIYEKQPFIRIRKRLRGRIVEALFHVHLKKSVKTEYLLGCDIIFFRQYLESLFQPGMTFENYGKKGWELDHKKPCAAFDLSKEEEQKLCFHYTNLQPLWGKDNQEKGSIYNNIRHRNKK